jgi:hypothetical protein
MNLIQLGFWGFMVQRLVDKNMSRNYYDYNVAKNLDKPKEPIKMDLGIPEDMRTINEVMPY